MEIGVFIFATDYSISMPDLASALEERGFASLFLPEHTHIPASRLSPFPGGGDLPREYWSTHDPFVALSFAAAASKKLKLGTGICLLPQRDPIVTAKCVASLDRLSGGRFTFGLGGGWNKEEMADHGTDYKTRFKILRERVLAMKQLWTEQEAEYHGEYVDFDATWADPKPLQQPHPPIILGGESIYTLRRVVEFCDGWLPRGRGGFDAASAMAQLKEVADEAGRDMSTLSVTVFAAPPKAEALDAYREAEIDGALFHLPSEGRDAILKRLDELATLL